jgi:glucose/arabinose dehydrogenase
MVPGVRRVLIPLALACVAIAACDDDGGNGASGSTGDQQTSAAASGGVKLSRIGMFAQPTYVTAPKGDRKRLFVVEQEGTIRVLVSRKVRSKPFLDISADVNCCGERGLFSMAFAPDYADSGRFYVYFTGGNGDILVQQFTRSSNPDVADKGSRREVIRIGHSQFPNHNGGQLQTGPDGMLYLGTGDGGGGGDPFRNGQSLSTLLAKLLRIDPRPGGGYSVPTDNPFRGQGGARGEIWSYGLRNPYRFSFDRKTGALTIGDVGQNSWDEVDFPRNSGRGANFGWSVFEANDRFRPGSAPGHVKPVIRSQLGTSDGNCALIGGYVVRDSSLKALNGRYVWGDNCNPAIYSAKLTTGGASAKRSTGLRVRSLSSFGEDGLGRVYATSLGGSVYRLVPK